MPITQQQLQQLHATCSCEIQHVHPLQAILKRSLIVEPKQSVCVCVCALTAASLKEAARLLLLQLHSRQLECKHDILYSLFSVHLPCITPSFAAVWALERDAH